MSKSDGGPAFPRIEPGVNGDGPTIYFGMTLRDYFAAKAMQAFCMGHARINDEFNPTIYPMFADHAYLIADAMIAERAK